MPARLWICATLLGVYCCGVHEYPQASGRLDPSNDFAPLGNGSSKAPAKGTGLPAQASAADGGTSGSDATYIASPSQPATLTLAGAALDKSEVIAFLHFGHSNMAGRAKDPADQRPYFYETTPHAWMYHVGKPPELAVEPYTAGDMRSFQQMALGPGLALLKTALELAPDRYFMSLGFGQSGAKCSQYLPGGIYYSSATQAAIAIRDRVTIGAIVIMLGAAETGDDNEQLMDFANCIATLVDAIRKDLGRPDLPLLMSDYEREATGEFSINLPLGRTLVDQIAKIPELVPNSAIIPTDGLEMQDDHHFNLDGYREWARRALHEMQTHGWFVWGGATPGQ